MKKCNECNQPGIELSDMKGKIDTKWNNLISFDDFEKSWNPEGQKKTKRTEVGLDVVKEGKDYLKEAAEKYAAKIKKETKYSEAEIHLIHAFKEGAKWMKEYKNWEDIEKNK